MSSRQEEKARRRAEREAVEEQARREATRGVRWRLAAAGVTAVALLSAVVLLVGGRSSGGTGNPVSAADAAPIPGRKITGLTEAAAAASCRVSSPPIRGQEHVSGKVEYVDNPPSSGDHNPEAALDGIYVPGTSPDPESWVHSLEHGRIVVQYRPGTSKHTIGQLETLVSEDLDFGRPAYLTTLLENTTKMAPALVAVGWGKLLSCETMKPGVFDAVRAFRTEYTDKGPEVGIPPTN